MTEGLAERPAAVLKAEHQVILSVLDVLENLLDRPDDDERLESEPLTRCVEFFRLYADACHHAKEEDLLFPVLEERGIPNEGGPIGVMLEEHRVARSLVGRMADALGGLDGASQATAKAFHEAARDYLELLRQHIFKEDHVLFEAGDGVMTEEDQQRLASRFCEVGCQAFGGRRRDELESMAATLVERWGRR